MPPLPIHSPSTSNPEAAELPLPSSTDSASAAGRKTPRTPSFLSSGSAPSQAAQRDNAGAGRPPRYHGDRNERPWREKCYENTANVSPQCEEDEQDFNAYLSF